MAMEEQDCDISVCMCYVLWGRTTDNLLETFNDKEGAATLICFYFIYFFFYNLDLKLNLKITPIILSQELS